MMSSNGFDTSDAVAFMKLDAKFGQIQRIVNLKKIYPNVEQLLTNHQSINVQNVFFLFISPDNITKTSTGIYAFWA